MISLRIQLYSTWVLIAGLLGALNPLHAQSRLPRLDIRTQVAQMTSSKKVMASNNIRGDLHTAYSVSDNREIIDRLLHIRHDTTRLQAKQSYEMFVQHELITVVGLLSDKVIELLDTISYAVAYWRYQQNHQYYYRFHKNPQKWFLKTSQSQEIADHLRVLQESQKKYYECLGILKEQLDIIAATSPSSAQFLAVGMRTVQALYNIMNITPTSAMTSGLDELLDGVIVVLNQEPLYSKRAYRVIKEHGIPSFINRYGAMLAVSVIAGMGYLKLQHDAYVKIDACHEENCAAFKNKMAKTSTQLLTIFAQLSDLTGQTSSLINQFIISMKLKQWQLGGALDTLKSWFKWSEGPTGLIGTALGGVSSVVTGASAGAIIANTADSAMQQMKETSESVAKSLTSVDEKVKPIHDSIPQYATKALNGVRVTEKYGVQALMYGTWFAKGFVTLGVPYLIWRGYLCMKSAYSALHNIWYPTQDVRYVQSAMQDMAQILTKYLRSSELMPKQQLGQLVYQMHVILNMQVSDEYTDRFTQDVTELASDTFDIDQKLHIIDRMYRSYMISAL